MPDLNPLEFFLFTRPRFEARSPRPQQLSSTRLAPLANYATEAGEKVSMEVYLHLHRSKEENHFVITTLTTPDQDSKLDLPIISSLIYCNSSTLDHKATEAVVHPYLFFDWLNASQRNYINARDGQCSSPPDKLLTKNARRVLNDQQSKSNTPYSFQSGLTSVKPTDSQTELEALGIKPGTLGSEDSKFDHYTTEACRLGSYVNYYSFAVTGITSNSNLEASVLDVIHRSLHATAATSAAPRPLPSSDSIRSNCVQNKSCQEGWNRYTEPSTPTVTLSCPILLMSVATPADTSTWDRTCGQVFVTLVGLQAVGPQAYGTGARFSSGAMGVWDRACNFAPQPEDRSGPTCPVRKVLHKCGKALDICRVVSCLAKPSVELRLRSEVTTRTNTWYVCILEETRGLARTEPPREPTK
uniref:Uncharacterized protein n=1 Tax=Timema cristinae TaxID=61476 RepID=A0A7R9CIF4_TIMCR|nr:unnamed protein product [Timema cristinae]